MFFQKNKTIFFILLLVFGFSVFSPVYAQTDQRCWLKPDCLNSGADAEFYGPNTETELACGMKEDAGGTELGFCLPVGSAETQIWFAEKNSFVNWGEFLKWIYNYGVRVAALFAVIVIVLSGFQWIVAAGNPERINSAKTKIKNALMGLFLAVMSYFILNAINPYLVNLRAPQVWKINGRSLTPPYCDQLKGDKNLAFAYDKPDKEPSQSQKVSLYQKKLKEKKFKPLKEVKAECGKIYFIQGTPEGQTCEGRDCSKGKVCLPFTVKNGIKSSPACTDDPLTIHYEVKPSAASVFKEDSVLEEMASTVESLLFEKVNLPDWLDDYGQIVIFCRDNGGMYFVDAVEDTNYTRRIVDRDSNGKKLTYEEYLISYSLPKVKQALSGNYSCSKAPSQKVSSPVGFYIKNEFEMDLGVDDYSFYITPANEKSIRAVASKFGGREGGGWYFPMDMFKNNSHFYELGLNGTMLENIATEPNSEPDIGSMGSDYSYSFSETFKIWKDLFD